MYNVFVLISSVQWSSSIHVFITLNGNTYDTKVCKVTSTCDAVNLYIPLKAMTLFKLCLFVAIATHNLIV